jgi:hypothetical protein
MIRGVLEIHAGLLVEWTQQKLSGHLRKLISSKNPEGMSQLLFQSRVIALCSDGFSAAKSRSVLLYYLSHNEDGVLFMMSITLF